MSTPWKHLDAQPKRVLDIDEAAAVEHVLDVAAAWQSGDISTSQALREDGGLDNAHRARGLAFRFAWADPRRPALERLSEIMSAGFKAHLSDGTFMEPDQWHASEQHVDDYHRRAA